MAIDDNTLYGLTGAQVKEMVQRRGNTEISQESSTYGNEGEALSLDSNGTDGHLRVGVDIMNDGSEGFLYLNDSYPSINLPSTAMMYQVINDALRIFTMTLTTRTLRRFLPQLLLLWLLSKTPSRLGLGFR